MEKIRAGIVIEMMGRPAEHIKEVIGQLMDKLGSEKGIEIDKKKVHDPKLVEQKDKEGKIIKFPEGRELYSTFAEIDLTADTVIDLVRIVFGYMPSHVEIISPEELRIENLDVSAILTEITQKLHQYDAIAKNAMMQNQMLVNKFRQMQAQGLILQEGQQQQQTGEKKKGGKKKKAVKKTNKKKKTSKKASKREIEN